MALEKAFRRLTIQPSWNIRSCHRCFSSTAPALQQRSTPLPVADAVRSDQTNSTIQGNPARISTDSLPSTSQAQTPAPPAPTPAIQPRRNSFQMAGKAISRATLLSNEREAQQRARDLERNFSRKDLEQQMVRRWKSGDVYAPHDLSGAETAKWKRISRKPKSKYDVIDQLGINPLHHYKNVSIMSEYMSEMGRIKNSSQSGLRPVNQRRMAKAIRRAIGIGLMPGVHRHPELLRRELEAKRL